MWAAGQASQHLWLQVQVTHFLHRALLLMSYAQAGAAYKLAARVMSNVQQSRTYGFSDIRCSCWWQPGMHRLGIGSVLQVKRAIYLWLFQAPPDGR